MVNVPFDQLTPEAKRQFRKQNPDAFPLRDRRPAQDVDRFTDKPGTPASAPKPKSRWEQVREGILKGGEKVKGGAEKGFGKFQKYAQERVKNDPELGGLPPKRGVSAKREPNRANWKEAKEPRGRVSQRDIYKDGVLVEKVHYGPSKQPKQPKQRRRREDPLGGFGAGMSFRDMMPGSNQGFGLGGMSPYSDPMQRSAPRPRKGKKGRRQPREEPFDYIEHMNKLPDSWKGLGF